MGIICRRQFADDIKVNVRRRFSRKIRDGLYHSVLLLLGRRKVVEESVFAGNLGEISNGWVLFGTERSGGRRYMLERRRSVMPAFGNGKALQLSFQSEWK